VDQALLVQIRDIHDRSRRTHGAPASIRTNPATQVRCVLNRPLATGSGLRLRRAIMHARVSNPLRSSFPTPCRPWGGPRKKAASR